MEPLDRAIKIAGPTQEQFATAIGKKQSYVSMMLHRVRTKGAKIPTDICPAIEKATKGAVTKQQLRPDVFGSSRTA